MASRSITGYFNPAGRLFIIIAICAAIVFSHFGEIFFCIGAVIAIWVAYFFRDPQRVTPLRSGLIVSPADGKIVAIRPVEPEADLGLGPEERMRISIFLNIFDVHVNRMPADGTVRTCRYRKGTFVNAS